MDNNLNNLNLPTGIHPQSYTAESNNVSQKHFVFIWDFKPSFPIGVLITDLESRKYKLSRFLELTLSEEKDCFRAESGDLSIWSTGGTEQEALSSFKKEVVSLYEELNEAGITKLGPLPQQWWNILKETVSSQ